MQSIIFDTSAVRREMATAKKHLSYMLKMKCIDLHSLGNEETEKMERGCVIQSPVLKL